MNDLATQTQDSSLAEAGDTTSTSIAQHQLSQAANTSSGISPLVMMLSSGQLKAENVEQAMSLQRQHEEYEALKAFSAALARFRKLAPSIKKNKTVDFPSKGGRTTYSHSTLGYTMSEVNPILGDCDLNLSWHPRYEGKTIYVATRLTHMLGHSHEIELQGYADTSGTKNALQADSSTMTYLERKGAFQILGLASVDGDDDGRRAAGPVTPEPVEIVGNGNAKAIEEMLVKVEDLKPGFRKRWTEYYSTPWEQIDTPPFLAIPVDEFAVALAELTGRFKEYGGDVS